MWKYIVFSFFIEQNESIYPGQFVTFIGLIDSTLQKKNGFKMLLEMEDQGMLEVIVLIYPFDITRH